MKHYESLVTLLQAYAAADPEGIPFCFLLDGEAEEQPLSYRAFDQQARAIAAELQALGLEGERVLLLFPQGLAYLAALFGCFYAGVIAVPAYPPRNNRNLIRLQAIMDDCGARHILADADGVEHIKRLKKGFPGYSLLVYESLLETGLHWAERQISGTDIAYLQYTSGSTGTPKGVIVTHRNMMVNIEGLKETYYPNDARRMVSWIPMYHDMGLLSMMVALTIEKCTCYFMSPVHFVQKPARWLQAISRYRADYTVGPNFALDLCCEKISAEDLAGIDLHSLRCITVGAEQVHLSTLLRFCQKFAPCGFDFMAFCPGYGLAEATLGVSVLSANESLQIASKDDLGQSRFLDRCPQEPGQPARYWVSNGHIIKGTDVKIVEPQTGLALPEGSEGEVWVCNPGSVSPGYWGNPEASQAVFGNRLLGDAERNYLRTGDLGFLRHGELFITGRVKDMIIIRGRNYYPQDIELAAAQAHPALASNASAAFAIEGEGPEALTVVQEVNREAWRDAELEEALDAMRQAIAEEFEIQPQRICLIRPLSLPKTSSGKVQRYAARQQLLAGQLRIVREWSAAATEGASAEALEQPIDRQGIQEWLRRKIAEKAQMPWQEVELSDPVKAYPLESIHAIGLAEELAAWLSIKVSADAFWAFNSIEELADFLLEKHQSER